MWEMLEWKLEALCEPGHFVAQTSEGTSFSLVSALEKQDLGCGTRCPVGHGRDAHKHMETSGD